MFDKEAELLQIPYFPKAVPSFYTDREKIIKSGEVLVEPCLVLMGVIGEHQPFAVPSKLLLEFA